MASRNDVKITHTPDGRILASKPRADGPTAESYPVPGELGALLTEAGYSAEIVVKRLDGGAIVEGDRAFVGDAMAAAQQHGTNSPQVREQTATGHHRRVRAHLAAKKTAPHKKAG